MKTMAEEISLHSQIGRDEKGQYCAGCNHRYGYAAQRGLNLQACEHVATQLTAAGFGLVADAKREALEEAAQAWWLRDDVQDRFGAWNWLINRAAAVRDEG